MPYVAFEELHDRNCGRKRGCWMIVCCITERYIDESRSETISTVHLFGFLIIVCYKKVSYLIVLLSHCFSTQSPPRLGHLWDIYLIKGPAFLFPVVIRCSVFLAIVSQLFLVRDHLQIFGRQDLGSPPETGDKHSATNSPV